MPSKEGRWNQWCELIAFLIFYYLNPFHFPYTYSRYCVQVEKGDRALLLEMLAKLEAENEALKQQQVEQNNIIKQMNNNIQNLCAGENVNIILCFLWLSLLFAEDCTLLCSPALSKDTTDGDAKDSSVSSSSMKCKINLASNVTDEEGIEVPNTKVLQIFGSFSSSI